MNSQVEEVFDENKNDEDDEEEIDDSSYIIEESQNGHWSKLNTDITSMQKLIDFDSAYLCVDNERGSECAWNEMIYYSSSHQLNRFSSAKSLELIAHRLESILNFLIDLDHANILKFYDYWFVKVDLGDDENGAGDTAAKLVVITEYATAGSLKKVLETYQSMQIKASTYKRWLNQILTAFRFFHNQGLSIFQGHLNTDTIFIQNNGVIKLTPTLLSLTGICDISQGQIYILRDNEDSHKTSLDKLYLNLTLNKVKDIHAIGRLAVEIFTAHLKNRTVHSPPLHHQMSTFDSLTHLMNLNEKEFLNQNLVYIEALTDDMQKDLIFRCLNASTQDEGTSNIQSIWFHPILNVTYSLKILSVASLLAYFQEKEKISKQQKQQHIQELQQYKKEMSSVILNTTATSIKPDSPPIHIPKITIDQNMLENTDSLFDTNKSRSHSHSLTNSFSKTTSSPSKSSDYYTQSPKLHRKLSLSILPRINNTCQNMLYHNNNLKAKTLTPKSTKDRKVSLTFLTGYQNLKIPHHFFAILEDIRSGLYPRLFKEPIQPANFQDDSIISTHLDFVLKQSHFIDLDRRLSVPLPTTDIDIELSPPQQSSISKVHETRRLASETCTINTKTTHGFMIELELTLKFQDDVCRTLRAYFPEEFLEYFQKNISINQQINNEITELREDNLIFLNENKIEFTAFCATTNFDDKCENICEHLAKELIEFGLINNNDCKIVVELFAKTIRAYVCALS